MMNIKRILLVALTALALAFQITPSVYAAYNTPTILGPMTGDCAAPGGSNFYNTTCSKIGGNTVGAQAFLGYGYEGGYVKVVSGASYTTGATDQFICVNKTTGSATSIVLTLPSSVPSGQVRVWKIKDCKGDAATNNVTVSASSGNIDGGTNYAMVVGYQYNEFRYDGSTLTVE